LGSRIYFVSLGVHFEKDEWMAVGNQLRYIVAGDIYQHSIENIFSDNFGAWLGLFIHWVRDFNFL
jgi:hypothetical protein